MRCQPETSAQLVHGALLKQYREDLHDY